MHFLLTKEKNLYNIENISTVSKFRNNFRLKKSTYKIRNITSVDYNSNVFCQNILFRAHTIK